MLLSPIFLALGAVATSVLNANGRFAAAAIAPITYNLAIIGAALILAPTYGVAGIAAGVVARVALAPAGPGPADAPGSGSASSRGSTSATRRRARRWP